MLILRDTGDSVQIAPSRIAPVSLAELRFKPKHAEWNLFQDATSLQTWSYPVAPEPSDQQRPSCNSAMHGAYRSSKCQHGDHSCAGSVGGRARDPKP